MQSVENSLYLRGKWELIKPVTVFSFFLSADTAASPREDYVHVDCGLLSQYKV